MRRGKEQKTVWVTGASSGLGLHTTLALRDAGWRVIAGARSFGKGKSIEGVSCLPLDVTSEESVLAFCEAARQLSDRVDAVVQCAGMLVLGSCEETLTEEYARVMNTNYLGMVRVNRRVLPILRAQGGGRLVLFSSINGLMGIPFQSAYTASKHAIEGYAECLQMETEPYGIQVTLIEPGDHRSGSDAYRPHASGMNERSPYAAAYDAAVNVIHHDETHGSDPDVLGRKVVRLLESRRAPFRRRIASPDQHLAVILHTVLPARWNAWILRRYYGRREVGKQ